MYRGHLKRRTRLLRWLCIVPGLACSSLKDDQYPPDRLDAGDDCSSLLCSESPAALSDGSSALESGDEPPSSKVDCGCICVLHDADLHNEEDAQQRDDVSVISTPDDGALDGAAAGNGGPGDGEALGEGAAGVGTDGAAGKDMPNTDATLVGRGGAAGDGAAGDNGPGDGSAGNDRLDDGAAGDNGPGEGAAGDDRPDDGAAGNDRPDDGTVPEAPPDCPRLDNPPDGSVVAPTISYGSKATYSCSSGYILIGSRTRTCQSDGTWSGAAPDCQRTPSCRGGGPGAGVNCGASGNDDCCASPLVPEGTFNRRNKATYPATVSDFRLDKYEITVGRFGAFVEAVLANDGIPLAPGTGAHPTIDESGWDPSWNDNLNPNNLVAGVQCAAEQTWGGDDENRPMNCLTWYEAFAFCAWDGGRLPTAAEWDYADAGGSEERTYPWGSAVPGANADLAVYGCYYYNGSCDSPRSIAPVGSAVAGYGKWDHADLAGNVFEWNLDWYGTLPLPCTDCARLTSGSSRVVVGGSYRSDADRLQRSTFSYYAPSDRSSTIGARCARLP